MFYPDKVKILDTVFKIEYTEDVLDIEGLDGLMHSGMILPAEHKIIILRRPGMSVSGIWQIIWHEIVHGILKGFMLDNKIEESNIDKEELVVLLSTGINGCMFDMDLLGGEREFYNEDI